MPLQQVIESTFFKGHDESLGRHAGITVFLTVGALGLSMATDDLGVVMEVRNKVCQIPCIGNRIDLSVLAADRSREVWERLHWLMFCRQRAISSWHPAYQIESDWRPEPAWALELPSRFLLFSRHYGIHCRDLIASLSLYTCPFGFLCS